MIHDNILKRQQITFNIKIGNGKLTVSKSLKYNPFLLKPEHQKEYLEQEYLINKNGKNFLTNEMHDDLLRIVKEYLKNKGMETEPIKEVKETKYTHSLQYPEIPKMEILKEN